MDAPKTFSIGLVQMSCAPEPQQNLAKAVARVEEAAGRGAQVICLPELFRSQYFCQKEDPDLFHLAETIPRANDRGAGSRCSAPSGGCRGPGI